MRPIENGIALLELVLGLAILGILLCVAVETISVATQTKSMPLIHARAARLAQDTMDAVMSRKFDENTPAGGVPHCGASGAPACAGIVAGDSGMDDVGDFNGTVDSTSEPPFVISVAVTEAGSELSIANDSARRITVTVSLPNTDVTGLPIVLSAYKFNY